MTHLSISAVIMLFCGVIFQPSPMNQSSRIDVHTSCIPYASGQREDVDVVPWNPYVLSYGSFMGLADSAATLDANSSVDIRWRIMPDDYGDSITVYIQAVFITQKSWMKVRHPALLAHEQGHFDITEYFARKLRAEIWAIDPMNYDSFVQSVREVYERTRVAEAAEHARYDSTTNHGRTPRAQQEWLERIQEKLSHTSRYSQPNMRILIRD